jgi:hypothetical protein
LARLIWCCFLVSLAVARQNSTVRDVARLLIVLGLAVAAVGLVLLYFDRSPLGRLPGDLTFQRGRFTFHVPLVTCLLVSVLLSLLLSWWFRR